ncbi:ATP phosphoribosyltransferase [Candidatus Daviesbacteria bacterium]|nr:ATP phosphoribosyltransferase [Candidatus Daviesbacteria bacterium]
MDKKKLSSKNLKLAIQKEGRLTEETLELLRKAGLEFESYKQKLFSLCRNFPLEILYVRDDDISGYVEKGIVDLGIVGQNILNEKQPKVRKLLNLRYGFCSLVVAVPKESDISTIKNLNGKTISTSYPQSAKRFFKENGISADIVKISGSVEITPALGIAEAIVDLTSSGSTMALNDLRVLTGIYDSEAILVANEKALTNGRKLLVDKLLTRFKGVLAARSYKYVMMNAPENILGRLKEIVPGLKSPTVSPLVQKGWISIQTVIKEEIFWETVEKLKKAGAQGIIVLPIEKIII